ncbi:MAG TPA: hypothetical protein VGW36_08560 [Pyrinomonadaceae bacterium]|nr:hypothetical protein [Pyrinomonadaceae bacterium]
MSHLFLFSLEVKTELGEVMERLEHSLIVMGKDLRLLSYLYVARFIVWRETRTTREDVNSPKKSKFLSA